MNYRKALKIAHALMAQTAQNRLLGEAQCYGHPDLERAPPEDLDRVWRAVEELCQRHERAAEYQTPAEMLDQPEGVNR